MDLVHLCLTGITYAIRIACIFRMEVCFLFWIIPKKKKRKVDFILYFSLNEMHLFKHYHVLLY